MKHPTPRDFCLAHLEKVTALRRQLQQLEAKNPYGPVETERIALRVSQSSLGYGLGTTPQNYNQFRRRLKAGTATIETIKKAAKELGCDCLMVLVPGGQGDMSQWINQVSPPKPTQTRRRRRSSAMMDDDMFFE